MIERPETRYARAPDGTHIAYQVVGSGPFDLVFVPGMVGHLDTIWGERATAAFFSPPRLLLPSERPEPVRRRGITHVPGRGATVVLG